MPLTTLTLGSLRGELKHISGNWWRIRIYRAGKRVAQSIKTYAERDKALSDLVLVLGATKELVTP